MTGKLEYTSNNSGGYWWLNDEHWAALEAAGWTVDWCKKSEWTQQGGDGRWRSLGALATSASKEFPTPELGVAEWESAVGMSAYDEGCNCCGAPHSFEWTSVSGEHRYLAVEYGPVSHGWS